MAKTEGRETDSGIELKPVYDADDAPGELELPGEYPFTRGPYRDMYRGKPWTIRQYAGFASAEETNQRFRYLLDRGQTGLSVAFDLPTQLGYDSDDERAAGEVGRTGVAIDSIADMELLFDSIPLDQVSTSMTINAPAALLLGHQLVEQQQERGGRVDRHRRRDPVERDRVEQQLHVRDRVDRNAGSADLAERTRVVGVVAELRRQVEGDREAGLAALEQIAVAGVRLLRGGEARVLPDRPRPAAVHVRVRAPCVRVLARRLERARRVGRCVDGFHLDSGLGTPVARRRHGEDRRHAPTRGYMIDWLFSQPSPRRAVGIFSLVA